MSLLWRLIILASCLASACIVRAQNSDSAINLLSKRVSELLIVPFCDFLPNAQCGKWQAVGRLKDFSVIIKPDSSIVLSGMGSFFLDLYDQKELTLKRVGSLNKWVFIKDEKASAGVEILLDVQVPGMPESGNVLTLCDDKNQCFPYLLASKSEVCKFVMDNKVINEKRLTDINSMQKVNHQVNCL